ncbi:MAG TPA: hypothetical protein VFQ68_10840 [Streptosporangiaceae bacterium]|nr:hypothetical protein [Streptosporangiaceae bacterium]
MEMPDWIRALAASRSFGAGDRRGTANLIDAAARARAAACVRTGNSVSPARPPLGGDCNTTAERPGFRHETWYRAAPGDALCLDMGRDRFEAARGHLLAGPETHASAHILACAIGLLLLGNCDFAALRLARGGGGTGVAGALVVSLLAVEGPNGVNLNPLVLS